MDIEQHVAFIHTQDTAVALKLVRLLNQHGVNGFWMTDGEAQKLGQVLWRVDAVIRDRCEWRN
jgi:hypothetical protein